MALLLENPRRRRRARRTTRRRKVSARRRRSNPARRSTKRRRSSKRSRSVGGIKIGNVGVQSLLMKAAASAATFWAASFTTRALTNKFPGLNRYNPNALQIGAGLAMVFAKSFLPGVAKRYATPVGVGLAASGILNYLLNSPANPEMVADSVLPSKTPGMYGPPVAPGYRYAGNAVRRTGLAGDEMLGLGADAMLFGGPELLGLGYDDPAEELDGLGYTSFGGRA